MRRHALIALVAVLAAGAWLTFVNRFAVVGFIEEHVEAVVASPAVVQPTGRYWRSIDAPRAVVWATGDGDARRASRRLVDRIARDRPDLLLYLGDVYERGTAGDYARNFAPSWGRLARRTAPTPGNHEWPESGEGYGPYWHSVTGRRMPSYYALHVAGWEVLALNSQAPHDDDSAQLRWLGQRAAHPVRCRLAFWHRPRYSAGVAHGDATDVAPLWDALRGRTDIVVTAHDHNLQRLRRADGIAQFVSGAGGRELNGVHRGDRRLAFAAVTHGALRLVLRRGAADYSFVTAGGRVLDAGTVRC
jgi:hypothetical protein